jgi:hypothetical protein
MAKPLRWIVKILKFFFFLVFGILFLAFWLSMVVSPVYDFPEPKPFSGDQWYNPYADLDTGHWRKSNFQVQSKAWAGMTNGQNNPAERVWHDYGALGYDVITISDYMKINMHSEEGKPFIPVYEHGFGVFKTHQVNIGAKEVLAWDYFLYHSRNNKQFILNMLRDKSDVVAIAHPSVRNAYSFDDMAHLTGYDLIECLSNYRNSLEHWDAALSGGKPMFMVATDDAHDLDNFYDWGKTATLIHSPTLEEDSLIERMRRGHAYGYEPFVYSVDTWDRKVSKWNAIPTLTSAEIVNGSWEIKASLPILSVMFIGQGGDTLRSETFKDPGPDMVRYELGPKDTYVRAEIELSNQDMIYLNPVLRTDGGIPVVEQASINWLKTIVIRGILLLLTFVGIRYLLRRRKKIKAATAS